MKPGLVRYNTLRWGLSTLGCPEYGLAAAVELADRCGIEFLEIRTLNNTVDCQKTLYFPENEPVMRRLAAAGRCRVLDSSFGLTVNKPGARETLLEIARTADDFGIPYIRIFGGGNFGEALDDERVRQAAENLAWFREQKFGALLALETHDIASSARDCRNLQERCGEAFPIIWDAHHTFQLAGESFGESFRVLGGSIVGVHFKDSHPVMTPEGRICSYDLIGEGTVPLDELFALLEREHCDVPVTLEHEKFWRKQLPELTVALDSWVSFRNRG